MESALSASRRIDGYGGGEGGLGGGGDDDVHADAAYGDMICNNKDWWLCRSLGTLGEKEEIEENRRGPKWFSSLLPILVVSIIESRDCPSTGQNYSM